MLFFPPLFTFGIKPRCFILNFITRKKANQKNHHQCGCALGLSSASFLFLTEQSSTIQRQIFFIQHLCTVRLNPAGQNQPLSSFSKRSSTRKASALMQQCKDLLCQTLTKLSQLTSRTLKGDSSSSNSPGAEEIP